MTLSPAAESRRRHPRGCCSRARDPRVGRCELGMVVLGWLLVVAAVAGLAAVAVVVVQASVDDTAEGVGGSSARLTAAVVAAGEVERRARAVSAADPRTATWADWERYFSARCERLAIVYGDVVEKVDAAFERPTAAAGSDRVVEGVLVSATKMAATVSVPQVRCDVGGPGVLASGDVVSADGVVSPLPTVEEFRLAARAVAEAAAVLRRGDTWAAWKAHFEALCEEVGFRYAVLSVDVLSAFNHPTDVLDPGAMVTQHLLDAATTAPAAAARPQIQCEADG